MLRLATYAYLPLLDIAERASPKYASSLDDAMRNGTARLGHAAVTIVLRGAVTA